ncbi:DUF2089 family protein [Streptococcus phocae]
MLNLILFRFIIIYRKKVIAIVEENHPKWLNLLSQEDFEFIRQFILNSGSLKNMATYYNISYPTIRSRLDKLIEKLSIVSEERDNFIALIKRLALEGEMSYEVAKILINTYKEEKR